MSGPVIDRVVVGATFDRVTARASVEANCMAYTDYVAIFKTAIPDEAELSSKLASESVSKFADAD
jgi:hypothetical protein